MSTLALRRGRLGCALILSTALLLGACGGAGGSALDAPAPDVLALALTGGPKVDDTPVLVDDINPGAGHGAVGEKTVWRDKLYFRAWDGVTGSELWAYDGTLAVRITDINPGAASASPRHLLVYDDTLYFVATGPSGVELYRYDGTTVEIAHELVAGPTSSFSHGSDIRMFDDKLMVIGWNDGTSGPEVWTYDGTTATLTADIMPNFINSSPYHVGVYQGKYYFRSTDYTHGFELWCWDGTTASLAYDLWPGSLSGNPREGHVYDGKLYFSARTPDHIDALFAYDGTTIELAADLDPGSISGGTPQAMTVFDGRLWGNMRSVATGVELFSYSSDGTWQIHELNPGSAHASSFIVVSPEEHGIDAPLLYVAGSDGVTGTELWTLDPTGHYEQVFDLNPGFGSSIPNDFVEYGGSWYFTAFRSGLGYEMYVMEGEETNLPPVVTSATPSISTIGPAVNHEMHDVTIQGVVDPDGDPISITIDSIHQDEPVDGTGDGGTAPDGSGVGTSTASVRGERAGGGNGRVYHIAFTATDTAGASSSGVVTVSVPAAANQPAVDDGPLYDSTVSD